MLFASAKWIEMPLSNVQMDYKNRSWLEGMNYYHKPQDDPMALGLLLTCIIMSLKQWLHKAGWGKQLKWLSLRGSDFRGTVVRSGVSIRTFFNEKKKYLVPIFANVKWIIWKPWKAAEKNFLTFL